MVGRVCVAVPLLAALLALAAADVSNDQHLDSLSFLVPQLLRPPLFPVGNALHEWRFGGSAVAAQEYVRLTSMVKAQSGVLWNVQPLRDSSYVEIFYELNIHGDVTGADGMVLWLTDQPVTATGPFLGGPVKWTGLAVALDSFDNDHQGNNPRVSVLFNDGTREVNPNSDGGELELGGCLYGFRNVDGGIIVYLKIADGLAEVSIGHKESELHDFYQCAQGMRASLPKTTYLSVTGHTGGLTDNHDVLGVSVFGKKTAEELAAERAEQAAATERERAAHQSYAQQQAGTQQQHASQPPPSPTHKRQLHVSDEELEKGLPEHHTRPPLAFHFSTIFKDLKDIDKPHHPDHLMFSNDLKLAEVASLKTDEERFAYILDAVFHLEEHTDLMIKAFENILTAVDNERFRVQQNHHEFAEAFNALIEQVATKKDAEEALQALAGKVSLMKASRKIHKTVDLALEAVEGQDSPLGKLGVISREMEPSGKDLTDRFQRNRQALSRAQAELATLTQTARDTARLSLLDYAMLAEAALFGVFVLYTALRKRRKAALL